VLQHSARYASLIPLGLLLFLSVYLSFIHIASCFLISQFPQFGDLREDGREIVKDHLIEIEYLKVDWIWHRIKISGETVWILWVRWRISRLTELVAFQKGFSYMELVFYALLCYTPSLFGYIHVFSVLFLTIRILSYRFCLSHVTRYVR
jgi:hypothetical protein